MQYQSNNYQICNKCTIDNSFIDVKFSDGKCEYCINFEKNIQKEIISSKRNINKLLSNIKKNEKILFALSGGIDSAYLLHYMVTKFKIKPVVIHVDTGWNSMTAVSNIENLITNLNLEYEAIVLDWRELQDLTLSFFKASVPTIDAIQDHGIFGSLYKYAKDNNFKTIITGGNIITESIREPLLIHYHAGDTRQIKDIHSRFGSIKIKKFPFCDIFNYQIIYKFFYGIKIFQPLNSIDYNKEEANKILTKTYGWKNYSEKHHESNLTKFIEGYWILEKFKIDKRRFYFSSLINCGQLNRAEALTKLQKKPFNEEEIEKQKKYICSKLRISDEELNYFFKSANKFHFNYKNNNFFISIIIKILRMLKLENRIFK